MRSELVPSRSEVEERHDVSCTEVFSLLTF